MYQELFIQLALILGLASFVGYITFKLKLPLVIAYLLVGVIIAAFIPNFQETSPVLKFLPEMGIAFLLFLIGMELDLREVRSLGKPIVISSLVQITISSIAGFSISSLLGFPLLPSILLGIGLSFSSTIVILKLLLEKKEISSLFGKLSIGITLVEDLVAILVLMAISVSGSFLHVGLQQSYPILILVIKIIFLFGATYILSKFLLERIFNAVAKSVELLFLTALTWCFVFSAIALFAGFSIVIGAFLAGIALAASPYHFQIQSKIKPLRDFFVVLFFVYLGAQVRVADIWVSLPAILALTAYVLIAKPVVFLLLLGSFGFRKHTIFQTSLNLSNISEFSLVLLLVGTSLYQINTLALSVIATVGVLSIITSSVMITYSRTLYQFLEPFVGFFEHKSKIHFLEHSNTKDISLDNHVVVIGAHRVGAPVIKFLQTQHVPTLILEFNPNLVQELAAKGLDVIYGDVSDPEILALLNLSKAKLVICTAQDFNDNEALLIFAKKIKASAFFVARASEADQAKALKDLGADYVILPESVTGDYLVDKIRSHWIKHI